MDRAQDVVVDGLPLPRLIGINYTRFKLRMMNALEAKNLEDIVYGEDLGPDSEELLLIKSEVTDSNKKQIEDAKKRLLNFKTRDAKARMLITCCMDEKHQDIVEDCKTSREIWNKLRVEYIEKNNENYQQLMKDYYDVKKLPEQTISEYVAKIDSIASKLKELGHPQEETALLIRIIQGLPEDFETVTRWWDMTPIEYQNLFCSQI